MEISNRFVVKRDRAINEWLATNSLARQMRWTKTKAEAAVMHFEEAHPLCRREGGIVEHADEEATFTHFEQVYEKCLCPVMTMQLDLSPALCMTCRRRVDPGASFVR